MRFKRFEYRSDVAHGICIPVKRPRHTQRVVVCSLSYRGKVGDLNARRNLHQIHAQEFTVARIFLFFFFFFFPDRALMM